MGINLSNDQIAQEVDLNKDDADQMTTKLREGITNKKPNAQLSGEVEGDEMYIVASHKGNPEIIMGEGRINRLRGSRGCGTLEKEKPTVFKLSQRGGEVVIKMLNNVERRYHKTSYTRSYNRWYSHIHR
jgi:hypothetical protein